MISLHTIQDADTSPLFAKITFTKQIIRLGIIQGWDTLFLTRMDDCGEAKKDLYSLFIEIAS